MKIPCPVLFIKNGCPFCRIVLDNIVRGYLDSMLYLDVNIVNINEHDTELARWWRAYSEPIFGSVGTPALVFFDNYKYDEPKNVFILSKRGGDIVIKSFKDEVLAMRYGIEQFIKDEYPDYYYLVRSMRMYMEDREVITYVV